MLAWAAHVMAAVQTQLVGQLVAYINYLLCVECTILSGDTLTNDFCVLVQEHGWLSLCSTNTVLKTFVVFSMHGMIGQILLVAHLCC